jgi:hypothetical protein
MSLIATVICSLYKKYITEFLSNNVKKVLVMEKKVNLSKLQVVVKDSGRWLLFTNILQI